MYLLKHRALLSKHWRAVGLWGPRWGPRTPASASQDLLEPQAVQPAPDLVNQNLPGKGEPGDPEAREV